ncbi:uncharacterized protein LOC110430216 [Sorghum bicolor]|uniref:uncharacterized protein LOC110430216 n=1 Tax=Sorghum bicolor TaxID=4558 RepID=UPI000B423C0A|nr:uncharacterized protein LOC110430216 [Sorghum bicolor]|eukprot:XP_021303151.1 uncharacterized protein LOC110430216 [Sorghum bicolor]
MALTTASKGTSTMAEYFTKIKNLADEMASAGRKLEDEEIVSYVLTGLREDFDFVVSAVTARVEPISVHELYAQLLSHEQRKEARDGGSNFSVNTATKGGRGGGSHNFNRGGRGNRCGFNRGKPGRGGGGGRGSNFQPGVFCQVCEKEGHSAFRCYKRFDQNFTPASQKSASSATTSSYGIDTNWYVDSGATDHVTSELDKLTVRDKYGGHDQVHSASGAASKNLLSVHRLARDNDAFLEFYPYRFFVKEQGTRKVIFQGPCEGGLYPLKPSSSQSRPNKRNDDGSGANGAANDAYSYRHFMCPTTQTATGGSYEMDAPAQISPTSVFSGIRARVAPNRAGRALA